MNALLLWVSAAFASSAVEVGPFPDRGEAETRERQLDDNEHEARVVRRYQPGAGWEYLIRVEGFEDADTAEAYARSVSGTVVSLSRVAGDGEAVSMEGPGAEPGPPPEDVIRRAVRAHGGKDGVRQLVRSDTVRFSTTWVHHQGETATEQKVEYFRSANRSAAHVAETGGRTYRMVLSEDGASLAVDGRVEEVPTATLRTLTDRYAPEQVLRLCLALSLHGRTWRALDNATSATTEQGVVLRMGQEHLEQAIFDPTLGRMIEAVWAEDGVRTEYLFSEYQSFGRNLTLPSRIEVWRGEELLEEVQVEALSLADDLPADAFVIETSSGADNGG